MRCEICHACSKPVTWKGAHCCGYCPCTCTLIKNPMMMMMKDGLITGHNIILWQTKAMENCHAIYYYRFSLDIRQSCFLPKQFQKSRSIFYDGSRSLGLFRKGKNRISSKFHWTDSVISIYSREGKTLPYS